MILVMFGAWAGFWIWIDEPIGAFAAAPFAIILWRQFNDTYREGSAVPASVESEAADYQAANLPDRPEW